MHGIGFIDDDLESERQAWQLTRHQAVQRRHGELQRLIAAASGDEQLGRALISDPAATLYQVNHICRLSPRDRATLCGISGAASIAEFAARLHAALQADIGFADEDTMAISMLRPQSAAA
jgi:hypothetical protein